MGNEAAAPTQPAWMTRTVRPSPGRLLGSVAPTLTFLAADLWFSIVAAIAASTTVAALLVLERHWRGVRVGWVLPVTLGYVSLRGLVSIATRSDDVYFGVGGTKVPSVRISAMRSRLPPRTRVASCLSDEHGPSTFGDHLPIGQGRIDDTLALDTNRLSAEADPRTSSCDRTRHLAGVRSAKDIPFTDWADWLLDTRRRVDRCMRPLASWSCYIWGGHRLRNSVGGGCVAIEKAENRLVSRAALKAQNRVTGQWLRSRSRRS